MAESQIRASLYENGHCQTPCCHSRRREHYDRNFAALFPVFDAVFGTAHAPAPDEYPETGLEDHDAPRSLGEAALWPVRGWLRRESALTERARGS